MTQEIWDSGIHSTAGTTDSPQLKRVQLTFFFLFFYFIIVRKQHAFKRNHTSISEFCPLSHVCDMWYDPFSWCSATQAAAPGQPHDPQGKPPAHLQPFCSSLSDRCSVSHRRYSILDYKISLVLDVFAQLYQHGQGVGQAKLWSVVA